MPLRSVPALHCLRLENDLQMETCHQTRSPAPVAAATSDPSASPAQSPLLRQEASAQGTCCRRPSGWAQKANLRELLQHQKKKLQLTGITRMCRKPTEYSEKTLQMQDPETCEGKKIGVTEVNTGSGSKHELPGVPSPDAVHWATWIRALAAEGMNKSSLSGEDCKQDTSGQSRTRARKSDQRAGSIQLYRADEIHSRVL